MRHCNLPKTELQLESPERASSPGMALHGATVQQGLEQVVLSLEPFAQPYRGVGIFAIFAIFAIGLLLNALPCTLVPRRLVPRDGQ